MLRNCVTSAPEQCDGQVDESDADEIKLSGLKIWMAMDLEMGVSVS